LLRRFVGTTPEEVQVTQDEPVVSPTLMQPEEILEERVVQKGKYRPKTELLVKWKGRPREDATWETKWRFVRAYPDFRLEDKATVSGVDCYVSTGPSPMPTLLDRSTSIRTDIITFPTHVEEDRNMGVKPLGYGCHIVEKGWVRGLLLGWDFISRILSLKNRWTRHQCDLDGEYVVKCLPGDLEKCLEIVHVI
ncbi:transposon ty3-G gag-pol polyprotein, partial [Tanacetum coccineum]